MFNFTSKVEKDGKISLVHGYCGCLGVVSAKTEIEKFLKQSGYSIFETTLFVTENVVGVNNNRN